MSRHRVALTVVWVLIAAASVSGISFQGLGVHGIPTGVSADGKTVVGRIDYSPNQGFCWTAAGGLVTLPDLPDGSLTCWANAVSADGSLIVGRGTDGSSHNEQAVKWPSPSSVVPLPNLPTSGADNTSWAVGISGNGEVIVGWCTDADGWSFAVRWTEVGGIEKLNGLGINTSAQDASHDGSVIVGSGKPSGGGMTQAFRWTQQSGPAYLGTLGGHNESSSYGVSADGSVVVGASGRAGFSDYRAFRWTPAENMVSLGVLPGGRNSRARAASADGSRIVGAADSGSRAFLWDAQHGMRDLQLVLTNDFGLDLTGWQLFDAADISPDGNAIVGMGYNPSGVYEPWIAVIPEPATLLLLALGGLPVMCRRR